jgi:hypothetical protein
MDEKKKPEASGVEPEPLGPYVIQEQVQQSQDSQEKLYLGTHEPSGDRALLRLEGCQTIRRPVRVV